jgi:murein L,D-transpeptidase YafK
MSIGQNGVAKRRSGDRRTPLGIYFVVEELDTSNLHEKYGPAAFPLDYPNAWDAQNARTGYGIWIHGVTPDGGERPVRDTDGCIALPNEQLLSLKPYLDPLQTPVIVTRTMRMVSEREMDIVRGQLLEALDTWTGSYRVGDWNRYLSMYADEFVYRGMSRDEWFRYRLQTSGSRPIEDFAVDDVLLLADPEEEGLYLSRFRQQVTEAGHTVTTTKRLYWRESAGGGFQIVAEDNG